MGDNLDSTLIEYLNSVSEKSVKSKKSYEQELNEKNYERILDHIKNTLSYYGETRKTYWNLLSPQDMPNSYTINKLANQGIKTEVLYVLNDPSKPDYNTIKIALFTW